MKARVGDRLVIKGHHLGDPDRDGEIVDVQGKDGDPPWVVRWEDSDHEVLFFPGPDAAIEHFEHPSARQPARSGRRRGGRA